MRVVYLVGNGFDIKLGLKTKYSDFYQHYLNSFSDNPKIASFKKQLLEETKNTEKWSDLELALGQHLYQLSSASDFDELFDDIQDSLAEYLIDIQEQFRSVVQSKPKIELDNLKEDMLSQLFTPEEHLKGRDAALLGSFYTQLNSHPDYFHIINFNYTNTIGH